MSEQDLTSSLMELHIKVGATNVPQSIAEETGDTASGSDSESLDDESTIKKDPQKTKITLNQSMMLSKLPAKTTSAVLTVSKPTEAKVQIRFKSIGSINQVRPAVFKISKSSKFSSIIKFLELKLGRKVYCYLNNSMSPNPDEELENLYNLFRVGDELIVSYCNIVAFG
ncbi:hypothetical protein OGAPHI_004707 [Ogataea philodendri]|uniref:Ubiquitin-like protein ATG12 n=1 Tax=Ogataea philodendri TaxID=1378263 RepID=A0A9P8T2N0_9ASCO|nr:uncharacterized protein OGAPHI_004707 [Ogataea philodendri]KAH3663993.1 hypothetical protein OGAPHI_004707 [Ogataea philodendri]